MYWQAASLLYASAQALRAAEFAALRMIREFNSGNYSVLRAFAGSIEAARLAGMNPAKDAATTNVTTDVISTAESIPFTS